jgi:hypothetical protein
MSPVSQSDGHDTPWLIAFGHDDAGAFAFSGADRTQDPRRSPALILACAWAGAAPGPTPGERGLLANASLILPPKLYRRSSWEAPLDLRQAGTEAFLKIDNVVGLLTTMTRPCRELAIAKRTELTAESVARDREANSSQIHCVRSASLQRTTPCAAGTGPPRQLPQAGHAAHHSGSVPFPAPFALQDHRRRSH